MIKSVKGRSIKKTRKPFFNKRIVYGFNLNKNRQGFIGFISKSSKPVEKKEEDDE